MKKKILSRRRLVTFGNLCYCIQWHHNTEEKRKVHGKKVGKSVVWKACAAHNFPQFNVVPTTLVEQTSIYVLLQGPPLEAVHDGILLYEGIGDR